MEANRGHIEHFLYLTVTNTEKLVTN